MPDLYRPPTMNISPIQTNVKDEPGKNFLIDNKNECTNCSLQNIEN